MDGHEWFRTTLSSIGDAVLTTDRTGCVTFMNPVAERLTGWMLAEAKGQPLGTVFHTGNHGSPGIERCVTRALLDDVVPARAHHTTLVNRTGMEYAIEVTAAPIREDAGRTRGVVMVLRDVAERLALEEELSRTAEELVSAQRSKDEFLAMLAHELRNPLAPLRNGIQILRSLHGEDPHLDHVEAMMERQIRHLARLVDDLLDVSRITRGLTSLRLETVPLRLVLEHALEITRPVITAFDHELNIALPPDSLCVEVDVLRASQVFANLLINAAEYTPPGGRLALTGSAEGDNAVVRVIDSGIGIPSDFLPNVFELFTQADRSLNRARGGLGIGLTVVKALVAMHGGRVHALSDGVGLGSEFVVKLPAVTRHDPGHVEPEAPAGDTKPPRAKRILVVDDNVDAAESLAMILGLWGHDVRSASSGEEALELALAFAPDVVLLDVGLPVMTGYEVARRMRDLTPTRNAMIVAVTGYGRDEDRRRSREAGIDRHLTKPVEPAVLEALLAG
jgi:PAS domain S-box-containing protein